MVVAITSPRNRPGPLLSVAVEQIAVDGFGRVVGARAGCVPPPAHGRRHHLAVRHARTSRTWLIKAIQGLPGPGMHRFAGRRAQRRLSPPASPRLPPESLRQNTADKASACPGSRPHSMSVLACRAPKRPARWANLLFHQRPPSAASPHHGQSCAQYPPAAAAFPIFAWGGSSVSSAFGGVRILCSASFRGGLSRFDLR